MWGPIARSGLGLVATSALTGALLPRSLPTPAAFDPAERAETFAGFGLRALAALLAAYLALVFFGLFLSSLRLLPASARRLIGCWTTGGLAGGLRRSVGLSVLALGALPLQPLAAHPAPAAPVLAPEGLGTVATTAPRLRPEPPDRPVTPVRPQRDVPVGATRPDTAVDPPEVPPDPSPPSPTVTVAAGESFWSIAERLASARLGRPAEAGEVLDPWLTLIEANRDRLVDPTDPGLLLPGQVLRVPGP